MIVYNLESQRLHKPYLIMDYFDPISTLEFWSQEVIVYDDVDVNEKKSK